jgi:hypothetical protein
MGQDLRNLEQKTFRHSEDCLNERGGTWGRKLDDLSGYLWVRAWGKSTGLRAEEFVWDSFSDGQDARGPAALQQGFQFVELGQFLTDGVGAFCVVGVVEG